MMHHLTRLVLACLVAIGGCSVPRQPVDDGKDYEAADRWVEEKLQEAREGNVDPGFAKALMGLSQFSLLQGNYRTAVHTVEPLAELVEIVHGPDAIETAEMLELLAKVYCQIDRCAESKPLMERAASIRAALVDPDGI